MSPAYALVISDCLPACHSLASLASLLISNEERWAIAIEVGGIVVDINISLYSAQICIICC